MSAIEQEKVAAQAAPSGAWLRQTWPWIVATVIALMLPLVVTSGHAVTMMSHMGIMVIFALSYNMLLGNTGLLSFGHAVYFGLGGYIAMHVLRHANETGGGVPIELLPLVGALGGLFFGLIFGAVTTRRAGTVFALISLGVGALVHSSSLMFTGFFGGEAGLFGNRENISSLFGISYGSSVNVYYLVVFWAVVSALAMYLLRKTPLGWMANAVRDNPERAQFVGYSTTMVRFYQFALSAFFAGLAGGLFVIADEIITDETVGLIISGQVLLSAYIGGIAFFFGPIVGAILVVYLESAMSAVTDAWMLYFGLLFIGVVMFSPQGLVGQAFMQLAAYRAGLWRGSALHRLYAFASVLVGIFGLVCVIELSYHYFRSWDPSAPMSLMTFTVDATTALPWVVSFGILVLGIAVFQLHARPSMQRAIARSAAAGGAQ